MNLDKYIKDQTMYFSHGSILGRPIEGRETKIDL